VLEAGGHAAGLAMVDGVGVPLHEVVEAWRRAQQVLADVVDTLRFCFRFDPPGGAAGARHAGGPAATLEKMIKLHYIFL